MESVESQVRTDRRGEEGGAVEDVREASATEYKIKCPIVTALSHTPYTSRHPLAVGIGALPQAGLIVFLLEEGRVPH